MLVDEQLMTLQETLCSGVVVLGYSVVMYSVQMQPAWKHWIYIVQAAKLNTQRPRD